MMGVWVQDNAEFGLGMADCAVPHSALGLGAANPAAAALLAINPYLAVALLALPIIMKIRHLFGPNPLNVPVTQIVNAYEGQLQSNLARFQTGGVTQNEGLAIFDALWGEMVRDLGQIPDPNVIRRSVGDRDRGGKFDWFALYRDPIAAAGAQEQGGPGGPRSQAWLPWAVAAGAAVLLE